MSCESLVDVGVELTTLFEFQFFSDLPPPTKMHSRRARNAYTRLYKNRQKHQRRSRYIKLLYTRATPCVEVW